MSASARRNGRPRRRRTAKTGLVPFSRVRVDSIHVSPENERIYRPILSDDPEIITMAESICKHGMREPIVITADRYIVSGHRRHAAAKVAGNKTVPVRKLKFRRQGNIDRFTKLLREYNRQRDKTNAEKLAEEIIDVDPSDAYLSLIEHRRERSEISGDCLSLNGRKPRSQISEAKMEFLQAVIRILDELRDHWPVSERTIHYSLLNDPPLRHSAKPNSRYGNNKQSSKDLSDLCTRARLSGDIPFESINDETRPVVTWNVHAGTRQFIRQELDGLLKGYWRDLMASQPNHVELLVEKNTVLPILRPVAEQYTIPFTSGRGFSSVPPRVGMAQRFEQSGKEKLILVIAADFDPSGESIAQSFAESMKHDLRITDVHAIKAALTYEQVKSIDLPTNFAAKEGDSRYEAFVEKYGTDVYELEALSPDTLQTLVRNTIDSVIDVDAFNAELDAEREDAAYLDGVRRVASEVLADLE